MPLGKLFAGHHREDSLSHFHHADHHLPLGTQEEKAFQLPTIGTIRHRHEPFEQRKEREKEKEKKGKERESRRSLETLQRRGTLLPSMEEDEARILNSWLACHVLHVERPDLKKDLEVFRYAMCCTGVKLSQPNELNTADRGRKERSQNHSSAPLSSLEKMILGGNKKSTRLDRKMITTILDGISNELTKMKEEKEGDMLYESGLRSFLRDLSRREEEILMAKVSLPDLIAIFSDVLSREAELRAEFNSRNLDVRVLRFENFLSTILKVKFGKMTSPSLEQLAGDSNKDLVQHLISTFKVSREDQQAIAHDVAFAQTQKGLFLDMSANLGMIDSHPYYNLSSFPTREMLDSWKSQERREVHSLLRRIDEAAYEAYDLREKEKKTKESNRLTNIRVKVIKARHLTGKGKNGKSDPYCTVEFDKDVFSTNVINQNLDPVWDEQVTLTIKEPRGKIVLEVWDKNSEDESKIRPSKLFKDETDAFLGMLSFSVEEILGRGLDLWEGWFPLEKRSKRSHVSGEIYLSFQNLPNDVILNEAQPNSEPVPHHQLYKYLLKALLKKDYENDHSGCLSPLSQVILKEYGLRFRVDPFFQKITYLGLLVEVHESGGVDISLLREIFLDVSRLFHQNAPFTQDMRDVYENAITFLDRILFEHLLLYRDCFPFAKPANSIEMSIDILQSIYCDPFFIKRQKEKKYAEYGREFQPEVFPSKLRLGLQESALKYYNRMSEEAAPLQQNALIKLSQLVDLIMDNLDEDRDHFERAFAVIPGLSISSINRKEYLKFFTLEIKSQVLTDVNSLDLSAIVEHFEFLHKLKEFLENYVRPFSQEDAGEWNILEDQINIAQWFQPLMKRWLVVIEEHLTQWIQKAIQMDKYEPMTKTVLHSTSVVDMFSAFDQANKFLASALLSDQLSVESVELTNQMAAIFSRGIQTYCSFLFGILVNQFMLLHHHPSHHSFFSFPSFRSFSSLSSSSASSSPSPLSSTSFASPLPPFSPPPSPSSASPPPSPSSLSSPSASHFPTPSPFSTLFRSKPSLPPPFLLSPKHLIILNNLEAIRSNLSDLRREMAVDDVINILRQQSSFQKGKKREEGKGEWEEGEGGEKGEGEWEGKGVKGRVVVEVVRGQGLKACDGNGLSDPYLLILSEGRVLAKTRTIEKTLNPKWEEHFELMLQGESELKIQVYDKDLFSSDDLCGEAVLFLEHALLDSHSHIVWLELSPQGRVQLRIKYEMSKEQDIEDHFEFLCCYLKHQMGDIIHLLIEQMSPFFLDSISRIVSDSKARFLKGNEAEVSLQEAQKALEGLQKYLSMNLSLVNEGLYPSLSQRLAKNTWKEILRAFKLILVPTIDEDIFATFHNWFHQKKSLILTPRQISMIERCLEVLSDFYSAGGHGLLEKHLKNRRYQEVENVLSLYKKPSEALMKLYLVNVKSKGQKGEKGEKGEEGKARAKLQLSEKETILQILQLRNEKETKRFVEDMLKELDLERKWAAHHVSLK